MRSENDLPVFGVDGERGQFVSLFIGSRQPNGIAGEDRRGPSAARQGDLPIDVFGFAPFARQRLAIGDVPGTMRSAKLCPVRNCVFFKSKNTKNYQN